MAGGIDWFRWHHGSVSDQKFGLVAHKAGASVAEVIAVWACLLEAASSSDDRGLIGSVDFEALDFALGMKDGLSVAIFTALKARNLIDEHGQITRWNDRQVKRERVDDGSTGRSKALRDKQRQQSTNETISNHATPCNATQHQKTPRGEKRREEKTGIQTVVAKDLNQSAQKARADFEKQEPGPDSGSGLTAEAAVQAMAGKGLADASQGNPTLLALLRSGITLPELEDAAQAAVRGRKSFAWALARAGGQRRDAAGLAELPPVLVDQPDPDSRSVVESDGERLGVGRWVSLDASGATVTWAAYKARVVQARASEHHTGAVA